MEIKEPTEPMDKISTTSGWFYKTIFALANVVTITAVITLAVMGKFAGAGIALAMGALFFVIAPFAWNIGNWVREFIKPDAYFTHGNRDAFNKRVFWLVGPQWSGFSGTWLVMAAIAAFGHQLVYKDAAPAATVQAAAAQPAAPTFEQKVEAPPPASAPTADKPAAAAIQSFSIKAPPESKELLVQMLKNATNNIKLAEIKAEIELLPKPAAGDRKAARSFNDQGLAALKLGQLAEAMDLLSQGVAADNSDIEVRNNYVYALLKGKNIEAAEVEAGKLLTYGAGRTSAWANFAEVHAAKGNTPEASAALVLAFQFSSNKDKSLAFLKEKAAAGEDPNMQEAAVVALQRLTAGN